MTAPWRKRRKCRHATNKQLRRISFNILQELISPLCSGVEFGVAPYHLLVDEHLRKDILQLANGVIHQPDAKPCL
eukprot:12936218-Prorocentrum_lima.AAC.1